MNEKSKLVEAFSIEAFCEKCDSKMEFIGEALATNPMQYAHRCTKCGYEENLPYIYPRVGYKEIGGCN